MTIAANTIDTRSRVRVIFKSYLVSGFARVSGLLVTLLTTPWLLAYLGKDQFGLWVILVQFFSVAAFTDFGLSNGLHNTLLQTRHTFSEAYNTLLVQRTFVLMCVVALILGSVVSLALTTFEWANLLNMPAAQNDVIVASLLVVLGIFYCNIPFTVITKVQFAYMDHHRAYSWDGVARIGSLLFVYAGIHFHLSMTALLALFFAPLLLANILNISTYQRLQLLTPTRHALQLNNPDIRRILSKGGLFFSIGVVYALGRTTDPLLIGTFGALSQASDYQILFRLFDIPLLLMTMLTAILWSAFGEALQHRQLDWIATTMKKICLATLATMALFMTLYLLAGDWILLHWVGPDIMIDSPLWLAAGAWATLVALYNLQASFLNATGQLKLQIATLASYLAVSVPAKIWALTSTSLTGFVMAGALAFMLTMVVPSWLAIRNRMRSLA